ncbi:MAG: bifunctional diaminohydroxyphosphoribosylaminopyrimidine deaminase/5-amino-6-(5-phosphoribosylamino)uracil reductase RibD, partial [Tepidisphaeraceae bacterium]
MPERSHHFDTDMMRRAIRLAMRGRGRVESNPMVACVLVKGNRIIGEGFHEKFGGPHAEPTALAACMESPEGATAYVTLEPCCHTNKKTPPCVPKLIEAKVARVVVGSVDPNPDVNGQGLDQLRAAGITVECGVMGEEAKQLLAPFIAGIVYDRPYVTLKWAESADGKVAGPRGRRTQIGNERSNRAVHALRGRCDAIVVGSNTVITDDPLLTARGVDSSRRLIRVVLDAGLRIPLASKLVRTARDHRTFVFFAADLMDANRNKLLALRDNSVEPVAAEVGQHGLKLETILISLADFGVTHALVESGP